MTEQLEAVAQQSDLAAGHLSLLGAVCRFPGLGQHAYSEILAINDATLGRYVDRLLRQGLVDRRRSKQDRRAVRIFETPAGRECFLSASRQLEEMLVDTRRTLPEGIYEQLADHLRLLIAAGVQNLPDVGDLNRGRVLAAGHRDEDDAGNED
ncbi:MarR family winged helix-turn-helix transcriptional regulator [Pukyongiella litopenaei]|nr:MarR family winged helix-turn-helix transcriptional regulator [Pukyongiella litopenaei]